jgi:hypothetical protein
VICLSVPMQVAVVDRVEESWAEMELADDRFLQVPLVRLPVGAHEGSLFCYCEPPKGRNAVGFQGCPAGFVFEFKQERRSLWGL